MVYSTQFHVLQHYTVFINSVNFEYLLWLLYIDTDNDNLASTCHIQKK